jgi:DnaJ like chaperone protein
MSLEEMGAIALCLFGGYWLVSFLFDRRKAPTHSSQRDAATEGADASAAHWAIVLGVDPLASMEEVRRVYRQRISEYHPDKVAGLGVELRELAEKKAKEINRAYDEVCRLRGEQA